MGCMMATSSSSTERTAASSSPRFRLVESFSLSESKKALPRLRYFALSSPLSAAARRSFVRCRLSLAFASLLSRPLPACPPASRLAMHLHRELVVQELALREQGRLFGTPLLPLLRRRTHGCSPLPLSLALALARSAQAPTSPRGRRSSACYYMATSSSTVRRACCPGARSSGPLLLPPCTRARARAERAWLSPRSFVRSFVCAPHVANVCWYLSHSVRYSTAHPTAPLVIELYQKEAFGKATRLASASLPLPLPLEGSTAAGAAGAGPAPSLDFSAAFQGYETPRVCARYRWL